MAGAGGIIRDHEGNCLQGFRCNIGICTLVEAKAWALWEGIKMAHEQGVRKVVFETDSLQVKEMVSRERMA